MIDLYRHFVPALLALTLLAGCADRPTSGPPPIDPGSFPPGAREITHRGEDFRGLPGDWYTFRWDVGGRSRLFLMHRTDAGTMGVESLTELAP